MLNFSRLSLFTTAQCFLVLKTVSKFPEIDFSLKISYPHFLLVYQWTTSNLPKNPSLVHSRCSQMALEKVTIYSKTTDSVYLRLKKLISKPSVAFFVRDCADLLHARKLQPRDVFNRTRNNFLQLVATLACTYEPIKHYIYSISKTTNSVYLRLKTL